MKIRFLTTELEEQQKASVEAQRRVVALQTQLRSTLAEKEASEEKLEEKLEEIEETVEGLEEKLEETEETAKQERTMATQRVQELETRVEASEVQVEHLKHVEDILKLDALQATKAGEDARKKVVRESSVFLFFSFFFQ